jgi:Carboxypeptidase regulatory-like domain
MSVRLARLVAGLWIFVFSSAVLNSTRAQTVPAASLSGTTLSGKVTAGVGSVVPSAKVSQQNRPEESSEPQRPLSPPQEQEGGTGTGLRQAGAIAGTVTDVNGGPVAGAIVSLQGPEPSDVRTVTTSGLGFFELDDVEPGIPYQVSVSAAGFARWESPTIIMRPGQHEILDVSKLRIEELQSAVTVTPEMSDEMAIQQVKIEEKQRGFGIFPNFFAVYTPNPAPLTAKLKFNLAFTAVRDPFTLAGIALMAGAGQAAGNPAYVQGLKGYGERFGANYANQFTTIMVGGAVLPSLLHQDPRYFYRGTGTKTSRALHALSNLFVTRGDSGRAEPNYSSLGGDLASAVIATAYYPERNEEARLVFENFAINTAVHAAARLLQEFVFRPTKGSTAPDTGDVSRQSN